MKYGMRTFWPDPLRVHQNTTKDVRHCSISVSQNILCSSHPSTKSGTRCFFGNNPTPKLLRHCEEGQRGAQEIVIVLLKRI